MSGKVKTLNPIFLMSIVIIHNSDVIRNNLEDQELSYAFTPVKVHIKTNLPPIEVGSTKLHMISEGDTLETPRWIAEAMEELGLGEIKEESFEDHLFRAFSREKIQNSNRLSSIQSDIYLRMRHHLRTIRNDSSKKGELEDLQIKCRDLLTMRTTKLLYFASAPSISDELASKISTEEKMFFEAVNQLTNRWIESVLEEYPI